MNKDNILDGMTETISLNKIVEFDGVQVLNMTADVRSEPNSQMNYTVSVLNNVLYTENLEYFRKENGKYIVEGSFVENLIESIYFDDVDSLRYFQETIRRKGIVEELEKLGIEEGDSVFIAEYEFEFFH